MIAEIEQSIENGNVDVMNPKKKECWVSDLLRVPIDTIQWSREKEWDNKFG